MINPRSVQYAQYRLGFGTQVIAYFQYKLWTHQIPQDLWINSQLAFEEVKMISRHSFVLTNSLSRFAAKSAYIH
jgi:hypothetical protein